MVQWLFACWYAALVRYALRATGRMESAEDIAQETFLLYKALCQGQHIDNPKGWTLCVAHGQIEKQKRPGGRELDRWDSLEALEDLPACRLEPSLFRPAPDST